MYMNNYENVEKIAKEIRKDIVKMTYNSGVKGAHLGGSMSVADILAVLYTSILRFDVDRYDSDERDRLILSKAHAGIALYAALHSVGFLSTDDIDKAMHGRSSLYEHPQMSLKHGIEFSGGSLGQGLSLGVGTALALKKKKNFKSHVWVILGDGECNEGQIWEAASAAASFKLDNLTIIIDANGLQYDGTNENILNAGNMKKRWESFGFDVSEIDGHDIENISKCFEKKSTKTRVIIARTIKGKGISFAENEVSWHTGRLTDELYKLAIEELNR